MDQLHRYPGVIRGAAAGILASTSELLQGSEPDTSDLMVAIHGLEEEEGTSKGLNATIADHLDEKEFDEKIEGALKYLDESRLAIWELLQFILD